MNIKSYIKKLLYLSLSLLITACLFFVSCNDDKDDNNSFEETIVGRWHLSGFETSTMYVFDDSLRYTIYSGDGAFGGIDDAIPNPNPYTFENNILTIDVGFGNAFEAIVEFHCDNTVVHIIQDDTIWVWWREGEASTCN